MCYKDVQHMAVSGKTSGHNPKQWKKNFGAKETTCCWLWSLWRQQTWWSEFKEHKKTERRRRRRRGLTWCGRVDYWLFFTDSALTFSVGRQTNQRVMVAIECVCIPLIQQFLNYQRLFSGRSDFKGGSGIIERGWYVLSCLCYGGNRMCMHTTDTAVS